MLYYKINILVCSCKCRANSANNVVWWLIIDKYSGSRHKNTAIIYLLTAASWGCNCQEIAEEIKRCQGQVLFYCRVKALKIEISLARQNRKLSAININNPWYVVLSKPTLNQCHGLSLRPMDSIISRILIYSPNNSRFSWSRILYLCCYNRYQMARN